MAEMNETRTPRGAARMDVSSSPIPTTVLYTVAMQQWTVPRYTRPASRPITSVPTGTPDQAGPGSSLRLSTLGVMSAGLTPTAAEGALASCASNLASGHWLHDGQTPRHLDEGFRWKLNGEKTCRLLAAQEAQHALKDSWLVVVGDSVARMIFSALLTLVNGTAPVFGWPTHRVSNGVCMAHAIVNGSTIAFGYYHPGCQLRWKGICHDDVRARGYKDACTLDYYVASTNTRLSFLWHTRNMQDFVSHLDRRLHALRNTSTAAPDLVFSSTGHWDAMFPDPTMCSPDKGKGCCASVQENMRALRAGLPETRVRVIHGFSFCPKCDKVVLPTEGYACGHWQSDIENRLRASLAASVNCTATSALTAGFVYLDVTAAPSNRRLLQRRLLQHRLFYHRL